MFKIFIKKNKFSVVAYCIQLNIPLKQEVLITNFLDDDTNVKQNLLITNFPSSLVEMSSLFLNLN